MNINARRIEVLMAKQGISMTKLGELSGVSRQNISTIVRRGTCAPATAGKLARGLGISVEELTEKEP